MVITATSSPAGADGTIVGACSLEAMMRPLAREAEKKRSAERGGRGEEGLGKRSREEEEEEEEWKGKRRWRGRRCRVLQQR